jgi:hypothetical protein
VGEKKTFGNHDGITDEVRPGADRVARGAQTNLGAPFAEAGFIFNETGVI